MNAHEIDYTIYGEEMQYVEIELDPQEAVVAEAGSFMMMDSDIKMDTIFGDGSNQDTGVLGKLFSAGKRLLTGESLFMTAFLNIGQGKKLVSFASPYPGKILAIDLSEKQGKFICQKDAFLCAAKGVSVGIEFSKRLMEFLLAPLMRGVSEYVGQKRIGFRRGLESRYRLYCRFF